MTDRRVLSDEKAYELLAFLVSCAETGTHEPHRYGPRRLLDAASLLMTAMIENASDEERAWLETYRSTIDAKKGWSTQDWDGFAEFVQSAAGELAREMKRRDTASGSKATVPAAAKSEGEEHGN